MSAGAEVADLSTACEGWAGLLAAGRPPIDPALIATYGEAPSGVALRRMLGALRVPDVDGVPRVRDAGAGWFLDIAGVIGGAIHEATGERIIREALLLVPKKNGKTTFSALLMLALLLTNKTPRKSFNLLAPTIEVANLAFQQAAGAVALDERLSLVCRVQDHVKKITNIQTDATLKIVPFTSRAATGLRGTTLIDELHIASGETNADKIYGKITGALVGDGRSCVISISTMSEGIPSGIFAAALQRARAVRDGKVADPSFLPILYEVPAQMDPEAESTWSLVNPAMGHSVSLARLRSGYLAAKATGKAELRRWASQHCNHEPSTSSDAEGWRLAELWPTLARPGLRLADALPDADLIVVGCDLGGGFDTSGAAVIVRSGVDGTFFATARGYATRDAMTKRAGVDQWLADLENRGEVSIGDPGADVVAIAALVREVAAHGADVLVACDPFAGPIGELTEAIADVVPAEAVIGVGQGWRLTPALDQVERWALAGHLHHDGGRYLTDCVCNVSVVERGPARAIQKRDLESKIDGASAMLSAVYAMLHGAAETKATAVCPWSDPASARDVVAGAVPMADLPEQPREGGYVRLV